MALLSQKMAKTVTTNFMLYLVVIILGLFMFFGCCSLFPMEHPFLLSDNRHLSFYVWRKIFSKPVIRTFALPVGAAVGVL